MRKPVRQRFPYTDALWVRPANEADWLAQRETDVTATDAAALFGVSPYSTPFELFHRKAGNLTVEFEENERMLWGNRLQRAIADGICADQGWRIINAEPFLYCRSRRFVGMGSSPDYVVLCPTRGVGLMEIKNVDKFVAMDEWASDESPVHIELQLQHQLECSELPWGCIGGLIGGNAATVLIRERDEEVGTEIGNRVTDLWRRVRDSDPTPPNYAVDYDSLRRLYKHADIGKVLDLTGASVMDDDDTRATTALRLAELCAAERAAMAAAKAAKEDRELAQAEILDLIRDAEMVSGVPGFRIKAATQYREARTQEIRATSFRDLRVTAEKPPKPAKNAAAAARRFTTSQGIIT